MSPTWSLNSAGTLVAPGRVARPYVASTDGFVLGETEPTWGNTGCRTSIAGLTRNETTRLTTTANGQVIEGLHLPYGCITVAHQNVTIRDCVINIGNGQARGIAEASVNWAIHGTSPGTPITGLRVEHVTIDPVGAGVNGAADGPRVYGIETRYPATFYRVAIRKVTDALNPDGDNTNVLGCYLATRYLSYDPTQADGTHNDGIQLAGGGPHTIVGNAFHNFDGESGAVPGFTNYMRRGQGIVLSPYRTPLSHDTTIAKNWFYGAFTQISAWPRYNEGGPGIQGLRIQGNRHGGECYNTCYVTPSSAAMGSVGAGVAAAGGVLVNTTQYQAGQAIPARVEANGQGTGVPA